MKFWFSLSFLFFFLAIHGQLKNSPFGCTLLSDNQIYFVNGTELNNGTTLHIVTSKRFGHIGIGFGSGLSVSSASLIVYAKWPDYVLVMNSHLGDTRGWIPLWKLEDST